MPYDLRLKNRWVADRSPNAPFRNRRRPSRGHAKPATGGSGSFIDVNGPDSLLQPAKLQSERRALFIVCAILFAVYVLVLLRLVLLKQPVSMLGSMLARWRPEDIGRHVNLIPFVTIRQFVVAQQNGYLNDDIIFQNLAGNLLAFVPWGFGLPVLSARLRRWIRALLVSAAFILGIELIQMVTGFGIFDVDDILLNLAGAAAGFALWRMTRAIQNRRGCVLPVSGTQPKPFRSSPHV